VENSGWKFDSYLDTAILASLRVLRKRLSAKTKDLTSKSLVFDNADDIEAIQYIALCIDVAEQEFRLLTMNNSDGNL
jgi:hypothetical protein